MRSHRAVPALCALLLAVSPPAFAAYHQLEEIPVESPVYRLAEDLAASYPLSRGLLLTKPWTRAELGVFLDQLVADVPAAAKDPAVQRLRRELEPEGGVRGMEPMISAEQDDASLELSPYARIGYAEDRARSTVTRDDRAGVQASLAFGEHALLFADAYAGTITPGAHGTPDENGSFTSHSSDVTGWVDRAYGMWATKGFSMRAGHTWLRWGPGASGTMALGDAAPAFDVLEARATLPGGAEYSWFIASLDPALETYLAGHRLDVRAGPSVELTFSELSRFNGTGNAALYLVPVVPFSLMERRARASSPAARDSLVRTNVMYAADFAWTWRPGVRLYGEIAVDDATLHNTRPLAIAWQGGVHLRRLMGGTAWSFRGEYSRVYPYVYSVSHHHDFAHEGFPTGSPLGPDADQWFARLEWRPNAEWAAGFETSNIRDGAGALGQAWQPGTPVPSRLVLQYPVEQDQRYALTLDWSPSPSVSLGASGGSAKIHALGHAVGTDTDGVFGTARATFRW
jgi:hypothetical protein